MRESHRTGAKVLYLLLCAAALVQLGCAEDKCIDGWVDKPRRIAPVEDKDILLKTYEEACQTYHGIDNFRASLLALLPFASGVGWVVLLASKQASSVRRHMRAIAVFGALVTVGLFIYEARGAQRCKAIKCVARNLEFEMGLDANTGQFLGQPEPHGRVVREFVASTVVYGAVLFGWLWLMRGGIETKQEGQEEETAA